MKPAVSLVLLFAFSSVLPVSHAAGALEINQDCIAVGCFNGDSPGYPVTITHPGTYVLTLDIGAPPDIFTNAITVSASLVDIDLCGHSIDCGGRCTGTPVSSFSGWQGNYGIQSNSRNPAVLHIHDGLIKGFASGTLTFANVGEGTLL